MKYLKIQNNGLLDIRLVALMGGTTKANKETLIGQFGSGLKYTLAYLLRNNLDFKIFAGKDEVSITTEQEEIREEVFDIICINGKRTSITANMGKDWQAWMIIRELWSNALDEGGAVREVVTSCEGSEGTTTFYIQIDKSIQEVLNDWGKYFIHNQEPLSTCGIYKIYGGGNSLKIYKQGILVHEDNEKPAMFSYDIANAELNELREYKGSIDYPVTEALAGASIPVVKYMLENINETYFEADEMCYGYSWIKWGQNWRDCIGSAKLIYPRVIQDHQARGMEIDESEYIIVPKPLFKALTQQFEGVSALRISQKGKEFYENYDDKIEARVNQALTILEHCGYVMHPELEFRYGFFEDKKTLACVQMDAKIVCVSQTMLQRPLHDVVAMLIEENEHFNTGLDDCTRDFQQHFIDLYTRALLAKSEVEI